MGGGGGGRRGTGALRDLKGSLPPLQWGDAAGPVEEEEEGTSGSAWKALETVTMSPTGLDALIITPVE
jgi:hypothetical protein